MKELIKEILHPVRRALARFVYIDEYAPINYRPRGIKLIAEYLKQEKVHGDYFEFGVFQGISFTNAYKVLEKDCPGVIRKYYAFDSFEGIPEDDYRFYKGECSISKDGFEKILKKNGLTPDKYELVKGFYNESLAKFFPDYQKQDSKAAFVYLDCDLYSSTIDALNGITNAIQDGTVISFNDWWCYKGRSDYGQQKAFYEWLDNNPQYTATEFIKFGYSDMVFIINTKETDMLGK